MSPARLPAAAPPRVRDRLRTAPDGPVRVIHGGPHALYLDLDGRCLGVVDAAAAAVPCALRVARLPRAVPERAEVAAGTLLLDGVPVVVGRVVDVTVPRRALPRGARPAARPLAADPDREVARLLGVGDGLTPYGDDVLCGWLAAHRSAGVATPAVDAAVRARLSRTTLLSATLLDCALHGEVLPEFAAWLATAGTPDEPRAAAVLAAVGHSSGRGLLAGARRGLADLAAAAVAA